MRSPSTTPSKASATRSARPGSNGGCATASILSRRRRTGPSSWIRGYHLGGRSLTWGRQTYRMSDCRLHRERARRARHRLADPLFGYLAVVRPRRKIRRHLRRERRSRSAARRAIPAAARTQLRRSRIQAAHETDSSLASRDDRAAARISPSRRPSTPRSAAVLARCATCANAAAATARISRRCPRRCRPRSAPEISPSSPTPSSSGSTTTTPSAACPAYASSTRRRGRAVIPGARRVRVRIDHRHRADPAVLEIGVVSERARERLRRGGPLSHGSRLRHRRARHASRFPRSLLLRPSTDRLLCAALSQHHRTHRRRLRAGLRLPGLLGTQHLAARRAASRHRRGAQAAACARRDAGR